MIALDGAEERLREGMRMPSLKERLKRWPRDYVETKVDCYLVQDGWTPREIHVLYEGHEAIAPSQYDRIGDRILRARKTGRPPLLWGWKGERDVDAERDLLRLLERLNFPRKGKP
jgi:hypothetical protein